MGDAFTIMTGEDVQEIAAIERFIGQKIPRVKLEGFAYEYTRCSTTILRRPLAPGAPRQLVFRLRQQAPVTISSSLSSPDQKAGRIVIN